MLGCSRDAKGFLISRRMPTSVMPNASYRAGAHANAARSALPSMARHHRLWDVCGVRCRAWLGTTGCGMSVGSALPSMARRYRACDCIGRAEPCSAALDPVSRRQAAPGFRPDAGMRNANASYRAGGARERCTECVAEHGSALPGVGCLWGCVAEHGSALQTVGCLWGVRCRAWLGTTGCGMSAGGVAEHGSALPGLRLHW